MKLNKTFQNIPTNLTSYCFALLHLSQCAADPFQTPTMVSLSHHLHLTVNGKQQQCWHPNSSKRQVRKSALCDVTKGPDSSLTPHPGQRHHLSVGSALTDGRVCVKDPTRHVLLVLTAANRGLNLLFSRDLKGFRW